MEHMNDEEFLNLKPGDYVRVRPLTDMQNDKDATIVDSKAIYFRGNYCGFNISEMSKYCEKEVKVEGNVFSDRVQALGADGGSWYYTKYMLYPIDSSIPIVIDENLFDMLL